MSNQELHLELLLGKKIVDALGQPIGHLEEVVAEQQGDEWFIKEYLIGTAALLERLSAWTIGLAILRKMGARKLSIGYRVPWQQLNLDNLDHLEHLKLNCTLTELETLQPQKQS